jgi:hypothetical protein
LSKHASANLAWLVKISLLDLFFEGWNVGSLNLSKIELVLVGWNKTKPSLMCVLGLSSLKFLIEKTFFLEIKKILTKRQLKQAKKNCRMFSWNLGKVSINFKQSKLTLLKI